MQMINKKYLRPFREIDERWLYCSLDNSDVIEQDVVDVIRRSDEIFTRPNEA